MVRENNSQRVWLDLPPSYGGCSLNSHSRSADEEFLGSFAAIAASLIALCRKTRLSIYIRSAEALESLGDEVDPEDETVEKPCEIIEAVRAATDRASSALSQSTEDELALASQLIRGHSVVEVPGKWNRLENATTDAIVLPESRSLTDFVTTPCKHEVGLMKQIRQAKQTFVLYNILDPGRQTILIANVGQCERDTAHCSLKTIRAVATMDCPTALAHQESSDASLFFASTLHRYGHSLRLRQARHSRATKSMRMLQCTSLGSRPSCFPCRSIFCMAEQFGQTWRGWSSSACP